MRLPTHKEITVMTDKRMCNIYLAPRSGHTICDTHLGSRAIPGNDVCIDAYHHAEEILNLFRSRNGIPLPTVRPINRDALYDYIHDSFWGGKKLDKEWEDEGVPRDIHDALRRIIQRIPHESKWRREGLFDEIVDAIIAVHEKTEYPSIWHYSTSIMSALLEKDTSILDVSQMEGQLDRAKYLAERVHLYMRTIRK